MIGWPLRSVANDYKLVAEIVGIDKPYEAKTVYTDELLDKNLKMVKVTPPTFE
jgi:hypothetical protein